ncbi:bifunctional ADP-dependent NAD(P)H-hydrate dehydratase/NAD(P)H-hydrate epimerase [Loktanella sp. S4079]|uniref:bifunctional ADP-dependent NAD(P)H-hydrate dehydratase/NAD(P)H-hydrate epimerase n=1 Tax=Loktanella sp. S4079 TaxID=579483 RepID=UPI0005FA84F2|nr:bifunctional ADP-dependent NAD(P)H-hydrate dehydratase/NAD(P)H-hydrate epimerase [Loktanella sp. S4079]KJZ20350.1 hypothetical protein TW80_05965 [Loktanella sp. S4079]
MTELLTAAQMRAIEQAAIATGEVTGLELMESAGRGVVQAIFEEWPELAPSWGPTPKPPEYLLQDDEKGKHRAVVLCGPGNNGGDGFVVARLLHQAGWGVEVFLYGDAEKLPPDARANYERWCEVGDTKELSQGWVAACDQPNVIVDALFGTGLSRPISCELADSLWELLEFAPKWLHSLETGLPTKLVAIDIPSGICADSGRGFLPAAIERSVEHSTRWPKEMAYAVRADLTVTFHQGKLGHYLAEGSWHVGKLALAPLPHMDDSKLSSHLNNGGVDAVSLIEPNRFGRAIAPTSYFQMLPKDQGHKYSHGHALILSGGSGKGGAARLAARGALRIGAGAVTVGCPQAALIENAAQLNAVMLTVIDDAGGLVEVLEDERINALCIGPGFGVGNRERGLIASVLGRGGVNPRPTVLDADALTLLASDPQLFDRLHDRCVLTPHAGEFARLFPDIAEKLNAPADRGPAYSKVDATREAAKRARCVVLFKGPDTVIADPSGQCSINASIYERAAPWLATAGSGDVLAGFITGLLARGFAPMEAAEMGAWLHTECALSFGPGLIAEDLPEELPKVMRALAI